MKRRARITLIAGTLALLAATPVEALAEEAPVVALTGDRSVYVDVAVDGPLLLDELKTTIAFDGSFAGWLAHRVGEPFAAGPGGKTTGAYTYRHITRPGESTSRVWGIGLNHEALPAGVYRFYLLTDGPAEIRIPVIQGMQSTELLTEETPGTPTSAAAVAADLPFIGPAAVNATRRGPIDITPNTFVIVQVYSYVGPGATYQEVRACIRLSSEVVGTTCPGIAGPVLHPAQDLEVSFRLSYDPGYLDHQQDWDVYKSAHLASPQPQRIIGAHLQVEVVE